MKLITFTHRGSTRIGVLVGDEVVDLQAAAPALPTEMVAFLAAGEPALETARVALAATDPRLSLADVHLESPILRPPKILAVGLNYADHVAESGLDTPKHPMIFNKQSTSAHPPYDPFHLPRASTALDYEGELAVVIGKRCRHVPRERTHEVIAGYTICGAFYSQGSAINIRSVDPVIKNCVFAYSASVTSGGAIRCKSASPMFQNCTFTGNSAPSGAVAYLVASSSPQFVNCMMAFSTVGEVIVCSDNLCLPTITCSNIYGCEDGDWIECIAAFADSLGNFSSDPMFCDTAAMDLHVEPGSPCAPANNTCGVQIGALEAGCP